MLVPHTRSLFRLALYVLGAAMVFGVATFWMSGLLLERDVVRATSIDEVRSEPGAFNAAVDRIDRLAVRAVRDGRLYAMEDHFLYVSDDQGETFHRKGVLPKVDPTWSDHFRDIFARHPIVRRFRQNVGPGNVVVLASGTILVFYDKVYRSDDGGETFQVVRHEALERIHGPFAHGVAVDPSDRVFFGEYRVASRPATIRVFVGEDDGTRWRVCHAFGEGEVFHVHSVSFDPFEDRLVIATGDRDEESGLFILDKSCNGIEPIGTGDQRWRVIAPIYTEGEVIWGSDDTRAGSEIFAQRRGSGTLEPRGFLGNAAYYGARLTDGTLVMSTAFSPDSHIGREHPDPVATVWISPDGVRWWRLEDYQWEEEEFWWGRSRAQASIVAGDGPAPFLFVTPTATNDGFVTYRYQIEWDASIRPEVSAAPPFQPRD
jgi:hypothetical protein